MNKLGKIRLATQIAALVIVNLGFTQTLKTGALCPGFFCYGCPWATFACPIGTLQNFTAVGMMPYYAIGSLGVFGLLLGRFWCGWFCPFGTVQDIVMRLRHRGNVATLPPVPWTKYLSLGGILLAAWIFSETVFCKVCPAGSLFAAIPQRFTSPELNFGTFFYVHLGTLAVAILFFVLVGRFWCRYLCPLGAIYGVFNRVSLLKVVVNKNRCNDCKQCLSVCPVGIQEPEDIGHSTDCIQCGKCISECPAQAIRVSASLRT